MKTCLNRGLIKKSLIKGELYNTYSSKGLEIYMAVCILSAVHINKIEVTVFNIKTPAF